MKAEGPKIIFENRGFVVVDKPAGLMVHAVRVNEARHPSRKKKNAASGREDPPEPTLADWLVARYPEMKAVGDDPATRPGIVHRLDKATSGVMIVARTSAAFERLKKMFQEHRMRKTYFALVRGVPKDKRGTIDTPIGITTGSLRRSVHSQKMAKPAVTAYEVVKIFGKEDGAGDMDGGEAGREHALLKVNPKTGRTHQIRVHLASIGHPIVGDTLYGGKRVRRAGAAPAESAKDAAGERHATRLMLHAAELAFTDDDGNRYEFASPLPEKFSVIHRAQGAE